MEKIIEIKNRDWMKGLSIQKNLADGGLFQQLSSCDPFESEGQALGSYAAVQKTTGHSSNTIKFLTNYIISGVGYILGHSDSKLLKILAVAPYTVTDISSSVDVTARVMGGIVYQGAYVYANEGGGSRQIRAYTGSDTQILNGFSGANGEAAFCIGADGNLYAGSFTGYFSQITSITGTAGNTNVFKHIDNDFTVRDIVSDGRYLVILADDNTFDPTTRVVGKFRCRAYFWDMVKTQTSGTYILPDVIWEFPGESYLIGAKFEDGVITAIGYSGIWQFNSATSPRRLRPFIGSPNLVITARPTSISQIVSRLGAIYWVDGGGALEEGSFFGVYAYGNPISGRQKIFYQPYSSPSGSATSITALAISGNLVFSALQNRLDVHNDSAATTRNGVIMKTVNTSLDRPHSFGFTKVVLASPLPAGTSVVHTAFSQGTSVVSGAETKSYSATNPKQTFKFTRYGTGATKDKFEELAVRVVSGSGSTTQTPIQRVTVYGTPLEDGNEDT